MMQETREAASAHEAVSKLPEEKKPERQLSTNRDETSEKESEIEKGSDIYPPEVIKSSTKMIHKASGIMFCGVCHNKVKASEPVRCPLCGASPGRMKKI